MNTNRDFNKQRRLGIQLALGDKPKVDYEDPNLYPSLTETAQTSSLLNSGVTQPKKKSTRKNSSPDGLNEMERKILTIYHNHNRAVADNDAILDVEIWLQEGLREVLESGSIATFLHWLMFEASSAATIERVGRDLRSPKNGSPRMIASEDARQSRDAKEKAWRHHWSIKDGGTINSEHELRRFNEGIDEHGREENKEDRKNTKPIE